MRAETKSLRRRKLIPRRTLPFDDRTGKPAFERRRSPTQNVHNSSSDSEGALLSSNSFSNEALRIGEPSSPKRHTTAMETNGDRKMFTSDEVEMLIQRLLHEQKGRLMYEFEGILQQKLTGTLLDSVSIFYRPYTLQSKRKRSCATRRMPCSGRCVPTASATCRTCRRRCNEKRAAQRADIL